MIDLPERALAEDERRVLGKATTVPVRLILGAGVVALVAVVCGIYPAVFPLVVPPSTTTSAWTIALLMAGLFAVIGVAWVYETRRDVWAILQHGTVHVLTGRPKKDAPPNARGGNLWWWNFGEYQIQQTPTSARMQPLPNGDLTVVISSARTSAGAAMVLSINGKLLPRPEYAFVQRVPATSGGALPSSPTR